jgi:hypothetical protein
VLVLDMIEILPPLGKYKYDTLIILPVKCYIDNFVCLQSCIRNVNKDVPRRSPTVPLTAVGSDKTGPSSLPNRIVQFLQF